MSRPCILVVDNHPEDLRLLEVSLKNAGFAVTTASNGVDALRKVEISPPDLIISETALPEMDGFAFVKALKEKPDWAVIPFLFLSEERSVEHKVRGLEQGIDDYLVKPVFVKELVARLRLILQRKKRESLEGRSAKTKFSGSLDDIGLVDLIQTIDLSKKTGALHLTRGTDRGVIYFQDGEVVDAEVGRHRGVAAVYRLLTWSEGYFDVDFRPVRRARTIHLSSQEILMEGMRRLDEWGRLVEQLPPLDTIFMVDAGELIGRLDEIPDEVNAIIRLTDGTRSLLEIIDSAPFDDLETLKIITRLSFYGIFIETGRKGAPPPRTEFAYAKEVTGEPEPVSEPEPEMPLTFAAGTASPGLVDQVAAAAAATMPSEPPPAPESSPSSPAPPEPAAPSAPEVVAPPPAAPEPAGPPAPPVPPAPPEPVAPPAPEVVAPEPAGPPAPPAPPEPVAPPPLHPLPAMPPRPVPVAPPPVIPPAGLRPPSVPTLPVIAAPPPKAEAPVAPSSETSGGEAPRAPAPLSFKLPPLPAAPSGAPFAAAPPSEGPAAAAAAPEAPAAPPEPPKPEPAVAAGLTAKPDEKKPTTLRLLASEPSAGAIASAPPAAPPPLPAAPAADDARKEKPGPTTLRLGPQIPPPAAPKAEAPAETPEGRPRRLTPAQLDAMAAQLEARSPFSGAGVSIPPAPPSFRPVGETPAPGSLKREDLEAAQAGAEGAAGGVRADEEITKVDVVLGGAEPKVIVDIPAERAAEPKAKARPVSVSPPPARRASTVAWGTLFTLVVLALGIYLIMRFKGGGQESADGDVALAAAPQLDRAPIEDMSGGGTPETAAPVEDAAVAPAPDAVVGETSYGWDEDVPLAPSADAAPVAEEDVAVVPVADAAVAPEEDVASAAEVAAPVPVPVACADALQAAKDAWRKRDRPAAFDQLRAAIVCDPGALEPRLQWARWVSDTNLFRDAAACAEAAQIAQPAADANPNHGELWYHYVNLLYGARQREAADAAKQKCLAIRPRNEYSSSCAYLPQ